MIKLINGDCLIENQQIKSGSVDLILTDLPYGTVKGAKFYDYCGGCEWDTIIEPKKVYEIANRILRKNGKMVLFSQEPYTTRLINEATSNIPFSYRAIWEKDNFANALLCNKAMVGFYEDILIFHKKDGIPDNTVQSYLLEEFRKSGKNVPFYKKLCGLKSNQPYNWFSPKNNGDKQWQMPTEEHYKELQTTGYFQKPYSELKEIDDSFKQQYASTFNLADNEKFKSNILKYKEVEPDVNIEDVKFSVAELREIFANEEMTKEFEDILVFSKNNEKGIHPLQSYGALCGRFINKSRKERLEMLGNRGSDHFLESENNPLQFGLCTEKTYTQLIEVFNIDQMQGFKPYSELKLIDDNFKQQYASTFNLWQGNKYKSNILKYKKDYNAYHPTQKPILLLEDLIKTFSNENDLVVDLTMGSGSTPVACIDTERNCIGIEKEEKYYKISQERCRLMKIDKASRLF